MAEQNSKAVVLVAAAAMAGLGGAVFFLLAAAPEPAPEPARASPPQVAAAVPVEPRPNSVPAPAPAPVPSAATQPKSSDRAAPRDRMARDLERERIWAALRREHGLTPAKPGAAAPTPSDAARLPALDREYIESTIAEQLIPVARECYQTALEDDPTLAGKLVANFTIVGAEEIGGIVEDASISEDSTLDSAFVRECIRESLMAVDFEPPPGGGRVEVKYPFVFEAK